MQSLRKRLEARKEEILKITETFGQFRAMSEAGVSSYDCFRRWLKEVTGNENFGLRPKINLDSDQTLGDQLVDAFLRKVATLEGENARLKERIKFLEWSRSVTKGKEDKQALAILDLCQG